MSTEEAEIGPIVESLRRGKWRRTVPRSVARTIVAEFTGREKYPKRIEQPIRQLRGFPFNSNPQVEVQGFLMGQRRSNAGTPATRLAEQALCDWTGEHGRPSSVGSASRSSSYVRSS
jgi:hypothetical protein